MPAALRIADPAGLAIQVDDGAVAAQRDALLARDRPVQQGEQGASLHADAGQARIEVGVAHVHDRPSLGGLAV